MEKKILTVLERIEKNKLLSHLQKAAEEEGKIPPMPFLLLRKFAQPLQFTGGILIGLFLGLFTILINYIIITLIFHL